MRSLLLSAAFGAVLLLSAPVSALAIGGAAVLRFANGDAQIAAGDYMLLGEQRIAGDAEPEKMISLPSETEWVQSVYDIALTTSFEHVRAGDLTNADSDAGPVASYVTLD